MSPLANGVTVPPIAKTRELLMKTLVFQILLLPMLFWFVWTTDIWTAVSLMYPAYLILSLISVGLLLLPFLISRKPFGLAIPGIWLAILVALPFANNSSIKPLMRGVHDLEQGMDRESVMKTLSDQYAGTSFSEPVLRGEEQWGPDREGRMLTRLLFKPSGRPPELQPESLLVFFQDDRYSHASFSAD